MREGEKPSPIGKGNHGGILQEGTGWKMLVDLDKQLVFPLIETLLRPDIVLLAEKEKIVILIELTCPPEENIEERHREKYQDLSEQCVEAGWKAYCFAVEVGARGMRHDPCEVAETS